MKLSILGLLLFCSNLLSASGNWLADRSSVTSTAETTVRIIGSGPGDVLRRVVVGDCSSTADAQLNIFNSSGVIRSTIAFINISTVTNGTGLATNCRTEYNFDFRISSAITYTTTAGGALITILWEDLQKDIP